MTERILRFFGKDSPLFRLQSAVGREGWTRIVAAWWPLAASWILMAVEAPALNAFIARLPNPEIHLAAYGGVVFPLALIVEAPIIMLLSASTAMSKDWASYQRIHRFMMAAGAALTALHLATAFTPLYDVIVVDLIGAPSQIVEPARLGLMIMTPWTWSIAYRRFNQGALIRFGHSSVVGVGTVVRICANITTLVIGFTLARRLGPEQMPGIAVGTLAIAVGVMSEALYVGLAVRPVLQHEIRPATPVVPPLTWRVFFAFYIPLIMTQLLTLLANPIGSAAISRMPESLASLASWSVVTSFIFILRSLGIAYNEVVVALLDDPALSTSLRRFASLLAWVTTGMLALVAASPLSKLYFQGVSALSPELAAMARVSLWLALPLPALSVWQSWYQGVLLNRRKTRGVTESVGVYLLTSAIILSAGVMWGRTIGLYVGIVGLTMSVAAQTAWLRLRAKPLLKKRMT